MHNYPKTKINVGESLFGLYIFFGFIWYACKVSFKFFLYFLYINLSRKIASSITQHKYIVNDVYNFKKNRWKNWSSKILKIIIMNKWKRQREIYK